MKTDTKAKRKRLCKACDGEFFPMHGNQGYCSNVCRGLPRFTVSLGVMGVVTSPMRERSASAFVVRAAANSSG